MSSKNTMYNEETVAHSFERHVAADVGVEQDAYVELPRMVYNAMTDVLNDVVSFMKIRESRELTPKDVSVTIKFNKLDEDEAEDVEMRHMQQMIKSSDRISEDEKDEVRNHIKKYQHDYNVDFDVPDETLDVLVKIKNMYLKRLAKKAQAKAENKEILLEDVAGTHKDAVSSLFFSPIKVFTQ